MNNEQIDALTKSIEHWYYNWEHSPYIHTGAEYCECCIQFADNECEGCPISEYTGKVGCWGTPYYDVVNIEGTYSLKATVLKEYQFLVEVLLSSKATVVA